MLQLLGFSFLPSSFLLLDANKRCLERFAREEKELTKKYGGLENGWKKNHKTLFHTLIWHKKVYAFIHVCMWYISLGRWVCFFLPTNIILCRRYSIFSFPMCKYRWHVWIWWIIGCQDGVCDEPNIWFLESTGRRTDDTVP